MMEYLNTLKEQFNDRIQLVEKRPGVIQLLAPFYHEDGICWKSTLKEWGRTGMCSFQITV